MTKKNWLKPAISFVAGILLVFSFAPFHFYVLAFISPAILFFLWVNGSAKSNFFSGLSFGLGLYGVGVSWVYVSLSTYGGMPLWMGSITVIGFASLLSLFIACTGYIATRFFKPTILFSLPFIWLIFEWSKSWVLTGFPWLDIGYSQTPSWFFSWAPVGGVYLVSFVVLITAACLASLASCIVGKKKDYFFPLITTLSLVTASFTLSSVNWSEAIGKPLQVGVVQPNTPIEEKWKSEYLNSLITKLASLSKQLRQEKNSQLIIWPETALPLNVQQTDSSFWSSVTPAGAEILTGIMDSPNPNDYNEIYNAGLLTCNAKEPIVNRKQHLVPFGEYLPLRSLFNWVLEYLQLPMSDLSSWNGAQSLDCGEAIKIGLSICYEDAFANEYRHSVGDATMLVNISEDAWFGDSFAPHQRKQMAQMRAAELARPLVRSANSGPSLFINTKGKVFAQTEQFEVAIASYSVQPHTGDTPYKRFGNWVVFLSMLVLILSLLKIKKRIHKPDL